MPGAAKQGRKLFLEGMQGAPGVRVRKNLAKHRSKRLNREILLPQKKCHNELQHA